MKRVNERRLMQQISQQIKQINRNNVQFYNTLKQLNLQQQSQSTNVLNQKLQLTNFHIKQKIKQLSSNVDIIYQIIHAKLSLIINRVNAIMTDITSNNNRHNNNHNISTNNSHNNSNNSGHIQKIKQLEQKLLQIKSQKQLVCQENALLNQKIQCINMELKNNNKNTNYININTDVNSKFTSQQKQLRSNRNMKNSSADKYKPASKTIIRVSSQNDLTFNNQSFRSSRSYQNKQQSKHSQSSFHIKQQNSFQSSYGLEIIKNHKFSFGCLPFNSSGTQDLFGTRGKHSRNGEQRKHGENDENNENHRWRFLLTNLKESQEQGSILKSQSSRYSCQKLKNANQNTISKASIKVYQI